MENDKKYYDLILELVQAHRKYPQVEEFEQSIIEDVYKRSKSIIDTIENDTDTVSEYLKKVVSISMIKIPQELRLHPKETQENDTPIASITKNVATETIKPLIEETEEIIITTDSNEEENELNSNVINDEAVLINEQQELISDKKEEHTDILTLMESDSEDTLSDESIPVYEEFIEEQNDIIINSEEQASVDTEQIMTEDMNADDIPQEIIEINDSILPSDETETFADEPQEIIEINDSILPSDEAETFADEPQETIEVNDSILPLDEPENLTTELSDKMINSISEEDYAGVLNLPDTSEQDIMLIDEQDTSEIGSAYENDDLIAEDVIVGNFLVSEQNDVISLNEDENTLSDTLEEITPVVDSEDFLAVQETETLSEIKEDDYSDTLNTAVDNSIIATTDEINLVIDENEIQKDLCTLDTEFPHLHILKIFDLKYKQNASIEDIAETLSISEDIVTEALYKIICIIGD